MEWISGDALDAIGWPLTLIWAGAVLLLAINLGYSDEQGWSLFFIGGGTLTLMAAAVRLLVPAYRRPTLGDLIWAGILFGLGTGSGVWVGSLILIAIGASMMVQNLSKTESSVNQER
jgi:hypothetical protein